MKRWYVYVLLGLGFGVLDWFYLDWLAFSFGPSLNSSSLWLIPLVLGMNYGIWLVPIIPVVILESRKASRIKQPILAGILTWCSAIFSYYAFYGILLSLGKLPNLEHLNIFGDKYGDFWFEYWRQFKNLILGQFLEWSLIAIIGGAIMGVLAWWIFHPRHPAEEHPAAK